MIEIFETLPLTTVQDVGRFGQRKYGVGQAGAMDILALTAGNTILGNDPNAAAIEISMFPFRCRFHISTRIALTGAKVKGRAGGKELLAWPSLDMAAGEELRLARPDEGTRVYLCVAGGIGVPEVMGSRSTQMRGAIGGFEGRQLKTHDMLPIAKYRGEEQPYAAFTPHMHTLPFRNEHGAIPIRVIAAGEYEHFTRSSQDTFWAAHWRIDARSNRTGYRLHGEALALTHPLEMKSYGALPGLVQVPPGGQPIIQMADANVSGGYPKIATVISADLWRLGQAQAGDRIQFIRVDPAAGVAARQEHAAFLEKIRHATNSIRQEVAT